LFSRQCPKGRNIFGEIEISPKHQKLYYCWQLFEGDLEIIGMEHSKQILVKQKNISKYISFLYVGSST
jgi:hypothetical protein